MTKLFGTDGIRGVAGHYPLDYTSMSHLGSALIELLEREGFPPQVLIGRDTRESGVWLEQALFQGILSRGGEPISAGIIPTSAVSFLTREYSMSAGIVISASHNPYQDNGIKIFASNGMKISPAWEEILETAIQNQTSKIEPCDQKIVIADSLIREYSEFLSSRFGPQRARKSMRIVVDCAHGASATFAPRLFPELGFETVCIGDAPDGKNINAACGSLYPEKLAEAVRQWQADLGIALDGDADRALWVDNRSRILNGDHTLYVLSEHLHKQRRLRSDTVVATIMSNLALENALADKGLTLHRAQVGDKYVLEQMLKLGSNLGGEQSGHTILLDDCPTGDGLLTAIKMLEVMVAEDASLSELVKDYHEFPQVHRSVRVRAKKDFSLIPEIQDVMRSAEERLGDSGRLNVRYSGTEPVARVMLEGRSQKEIEELAAEIAAAIARNLGE